MIRETMSRALVAGAVLGLALAAVPTMAAVPVNAIQSGQQVRVETSAKAAWRGRTCWWIGARLRCF